jgi:hypothetical protein
MTKTNPREGKTWPGFILGGRMRTSTLVLIIAFVALGWLYETYEPPLPPPDQVPATEVVPPGFIPDPAYTWAPRTDVQRHTPVPTETAEETTTTSPPSAPETTPTTPAAPLTSGEPTSGPPTPSTSIAPLTPTPSASATPPRPGPSSTPVTPPPASLPSLSRPAAPLTPAPTP